MQGIQTRATPCDRPVKKRSKKKGGSGGSSKSVREVVLEFLATHISSCLRPSLQRMKQKIQQQQALEKNEESASRACFNA
ncbi:hypothetical protein AVEN_65229-1 [Araneus ventricosus]|uniref:Uncharacterized protein n=1 Tax=Araneus ventricosus TaxID=182803 RepID=A0A4Y2AHF9_ARAVE|nr:hypothetical protein AVEN_65229-1 [Araneus ventricosus]